MLRPLRVTAVRFLNARPLWVGLEGRSDVDLVLDTPARCAAALADGRCDVALVPVAELIRQTEFRPLGRGVIAARDRARSVLLSCPCPTRRLVAIRGDPASCTSNALARILLHRRHGRILPLLTDEEPAPAHRTGRVVIGDAALSLPPDFETLDLAREWRAWTSLPFLFARWATTHPHPPRRWSRLLDLALQEGLGRRPALARAASFELGLPVGDLEDYLMRDLCYEDRRLLQRAQRRFARCLGHLDRADVPAGVAAR